MAVILVTCQLTGSPVFAASPTTTTVTNTPSPATATNATATTPTVPQGPAPHITASDADDKIVILNKTGRVTVVLLCTEQSQKQTRDAAALLDKYRGLSTFRLIAIVDLRDSLGSMVEGIVRWRMQDDLDDEAERLTPFYRANNNPNDPRNDLSAIPDFKGDICKAVGWVKVSNKLRCVVYGPQGYPLRRWDDLKNYDELYTTVTAALDELKKK